eukprot:GILI01003898.1.p1 GENE.GILI01003898.1~~GILI01003898.1.p1  ORF type:complete len:144 (+),score=14.35 GILI01003898.1:283-714(+)
MCAIESQMIKCHQAAVSPLTVNQPNQQQAVARGYLLLEGLVDREDRTEHGLPMTYEHLQNHFMESAWDESSKDNVEVGQLWKYDYPMCFAAIDTHGTSVEFKYYRWRGKWEAVANFARCMKRFHRLRSAKSSTLLQLVAYLPT